MTIERLIMINQRYSQTNAVLQICTSDMHFRYAAFQICTATDTLERTYDIINTHDSVNKVQPMHKKLYLYYRLCINNINIYIFIYKYGIGLYM